MNNDPILEFPNGQLPDRHSLGEGRTTALRQPSTDPPLIHLQPDRAAQFLPVTHAFAGQPGVPGEPQPCPPRLSPPSIKRSRNGKIARLPRTARDLVNRMLFNHIPFAKIVAALEELAFTATARNVSNWKTRGGYREWCLAQDHALQTHLDQEKLTALVRKHNACELSEVGLQAAATQLSRFFLSAQAAALLATHPKEYASRVTMLAKVSVQLKALQKYRDDCGKSVYENPERLHREAQNDTEDVRRFFSSGTSNDPDLPGTPHRNFLPPD